MYILCLIYKYQILCKYIALVSSTDLLKLSQQYTNSGSERVALIREFYIFNYENFPYFVKFQM